LQHLLLIGEHELTVDDKNRLSIPSEIRKSINSERDGEFFYLTIGINGKPWLYAQKYYEQMVFQAQQDITPGQEQLDFDHMNYALASKVDWDSQGRLGIPEKTIRRTGMTREVTLIGSRDHLEVWNRTDWDAHREQLLARSSDVVNRARQARQAPAAGLIAK